MLLFNRKKLKVLFIVLTYLRSEGNIGTYQDFPYGILSIIEHTKLLAEFELLDIVIDDTLDGEWTKVVAAKLKDFNPDIVGISVMFDNAYHCVQPTAALAKKLLKGDVIVVAGGPAVSPVAKEVLRSQESLDAICFSEGEKAFEDLLSAKDPLDLLTTHKTWVSRSDLATSEKPQKSLLANLDGVSDVNFGLVDTQKYQARASFNPLLDNIDDHALLKLFPVVTSRGCPFECSFCWHSGEDDRSMRYASVDSVISHVKRLIKEYGANAISIYDDMFLLPKERAKEIFKRLAEFDIRIELPNGLSPTYIDREMIELMSAAGVRSIRLAIESGDEEVLHNIINKPLRVKKIKPMVRIVQEFNIWIVGFFVVGLPGETDEQRRTTVNLIKDVGIDLSVLSIASPSVGSLLYEQCIENDYIPKPTEGEYAIRQSLGRGGGGGGKISTPDFSAEYIADQAYLMNLEVNFVYNRRMLNGESSLALKYFKYIVSTYPKHAFGHYFIAKILLQMSKHEEANKHIKMVQKICKEDSNWLIYFKNFKITPLLTSLKNYPDREVVIN
jgi:anaerobic magnesium-protoporphyrin IX monomethyl ester cyclase